jgi:hypothetical protein
MSPARFFLLVFILALAVIAILAISVVISGSRSEFEIKVLLSTVSIGVYSLVALCCATGYGDTNLRPLAILGMAACGFGLGFALLTNWQILEPTLKNLVKLRVAFLSFPVSLAATTLMARISAPSLPVQFSRAGTIGLVWIATVLLNILITSEGNVGDRVTFAKILATASILAVLGLIATPILKKVFPE